MRTKAIFVVLTAAFILALAAPALEALASGPDTSQGGGEFYRLRGSVDIHTKDCKKVRNADPAGVVRADLKDGPPCFYCLRKKSK